VVREAGDIFGDAVNIASRLQPFAEPEGICVSQQVFDQIHNKIGYLLQQLKHPELKNVKFQTNVYSIIMPWWEAAKGSRVITSSREFFDPRRLAVLPFSNISPDPRDEYFSDGMTDEMISVLSKIKGVRVLARTTSMRFKGEKASAKQIAEELKVGSLIEGSVRKSGNRARISVQLVDPKREEQLWSETYDQNLEDIFSVQSDIARRVARSLEVELGTGEIIDEHTTQNPEAYSFYLKGRNRWNARTEAEMGRAIKYFEEALARDPTYSLAYVGLADCYGILGYYGYRRPTIAYPRARELVERALDIDDNLAEAHASLGQILMNFYFDWEKAGSELDKALELNPSYATAHFWRATHYAARCRFEDCLAEIGKAADWIRCR